MVARVNAPRPRGRAVVLCARCHSWAFTTKEEQEEIAEMALSTMVCQLAGTKGITDVIRINKMQKMLFNPLICYHEFLKCMIKK